MYIMHNLFIMAVIAKDLFSLPSAFADHTSDRQRYFRKRGSFFVAMLC